MKLKWIFLSFCLAGCTASWSQSVSEILYRHLDESALIVRLPSQENKIVAMQNALADPELNEASKKRLKDQLDATLKETEEKNKTIVKTFREYFTAVPLFFVYDTTRNLKKTDYLDENLQTISDNPVNYLIQVRFGRPLVDSGNRPESMVLTDDTLQDLERPFPKPLAMTGIGYGINKLLAPKIAFEKMLSRRVRKFNGQFLEMLGRR